MRADAGARTMARMLAPNTHIEEIPVLVVGGGPAGLAAAVELARHEIPALLVERRANLSSHPRAPLLSLRAVGRMRAWGLEGAGRSRDPGGGNRLLGGRKLGRAGPRPLAG